jgi:trehalose-phosphatase
MQILRAGYDLDGFFRRLAGARTRLLMLDYDGTLAPFHADPAQAVPYPGVIPLLDEIVAAGHTRMVIVSGRSAAQLTPLLGLRRMPEVWGSHGWERMRPDGAYDAAQIGAGTRDALAHAEGWIGEIEAMGARGERKPAGLAFHWRGLDEERVRRIRATVYGRWVEHDLGDDLDWHDFDGGIELRAPGRNKGDVVRMLVAEAGAGAAIGYFGDDLTDEQAFEAMPADGLAVLARPRSRPTAAALWLQPPEELLDCLRRWHSTAAAGDRAARD